MFLAVWAGAVQVRKALSDNRQRLDWYESDPYLVPIKVALYASGGFDRMLSDLYWLISINYMGTRNTNMPGINLRALYPMGELITDLDPHFTSAYHQIGLALTDERFMTRILEADCLYAKGSVYNPDYHLFYLFRAFNLWYYFGESEQSVKLFFKAADKMENPLWVRGLARRISENADRGQLAEKLIRRRLATTVEDNERKRLEKQLAIIRLNRTTRYVNCAIKLFQQENGRRPKNIAELYDNDFLPGYPQDPMGGEIIIGKKGWAQSTERPEFVPLEHKAPYNVSQIPADFRCREPGEPLRVRPLDEIKQPTSEQFQQTTVAQMCDPEVLENIIRLRKGNLKQAREREEQSGGDLPEQQRNEGETGGAKP